VFTELLPGKVLIKYVTILINSLASIHIAYLLWYVFSLLFILKTVRHREKVTELEIHVTSLSAAFVPNI
jgi:hypothetical protein